MTLVSMEKRDPILFYGIKQPYFGLVNFKFTGVVTTPQEVLQKKLRKTRVNGEGCSYLIFKFIGSGNHPLCKQRKAIRKMMVQFSSTN